jgi:hypothetical protein
MPHEKINQRTDPFIFENQLIVGWNEIGWVQVSVAPPGWKDTGDWSIVDMSAKDIDKLIKVLKKASRKAYPRDAENRRA